MPELDRRIIVRRTMTDFNDDGERAIVSQTDFPVWATRMDRSQADKDTEGGVTNLPVRAYRIRYRQDIADAVTSELSIVDGSLVLNATNVIDAPEREERRKFIIIEATGEES